VPECLTTVTFQASHLRLQQCKRRSAGKLLVSTTEMAAISNARPNLNIGLDLWSNSLVKVETS